MQLQFIAFVALLIGGLPALIVFAHFVEHKSNAWQYAFAVTCLVWVVLITGPFFFWPYADI